MLDGPAVEAADTVPYTLSVMDSLPQSSRMMTCAWYWVPGSAD